MSVSEVAQLRERIANEYRAAKWGLSGLAYGTAQHQFITARMVHAAVETMTGIPFTGAIHVIGEE
ncbi:MAG: hypothetical protein H0U76_10170 [Ktedonobacteraceae bacterium]|nr:hypothetical protein [Ktedonobacteraceae bacterium]